MPIIKITKFKSSDLNSDFVFVNNVEISSAPFGNGAFGKVYYSLKINDIPATNQAIKIFEDDGHGSAQRGLNTIIKLQDAIVYFNLKLKHNGSKSIEKINSLSALPQFSFEGVLNGINIKGYSANLLDNTEWIEFARIFNEDDLQQRADLRKNFYSSDINVRLKMAYDLVEGFSYLEQMKFIYADLNPKNFFVNLKTQQLCLIDYEGGAINENPEVFGKPGEWLAPEIQSQILNKNPLIKVDTNTDTWAVAIGVHFLLFPFHPLFYLKVRGKFQMEEYFRTFKWPNVSISHQNFRLPKPYSWYTHQLANNTPISLIKAFDITINNGYYNPNQRVSYKQWLNILKGLMKPPVIHSFTEIRLQGSTLLRWNVSDFNIIKIDKIGDVTTKSEIVVNPKISTTYTLQVENIFGLSSKSITVQVIPLPKILNFSLKTNKIKLGELIEFSWKTQFSHLVHLDIGQGKFEVPSEGSQTIFPKNSGIFTIYVLGIDRITVISQSIEFEVIQPITINSFKSSKISVNENELFRLSWNVKHATSLVLKPLEKEVSNKSWIDTVATETTNYQLIARNKFFSEYKSIEVIVIPTARIIGFRPRLRTLLHNSSTELIWKIENAEYAKLDTGFEILDIPLNGSKLVSPSSSQVYKLIIIALDGKTIIEESTSITVIRPAIIKEFRPQNKTIVKGTSTQLTWKVENGTELTIFPHNLNVTGKASVTVTPDLTTTYVLTAKNELHSVSTECIVEVRKVPISWWKPLLACLIIILIGVIGSYWHKQTTAKEKIKKIELLLLQGQEIAPNDFVAAKQIFYEVMKLNNSLPQDLRVTTIAIVAQEFIQEGDKRCNLKLTALNYIAENNYQLAAILTENPNPKTCK